MRAGYYSDKYFVRASEILVADGYRPRVTTQVHDGDKVELWPAGPSGVFA